MKNFIPIDLSFPDHPKTLRLERMLPGAAAHLIFLWIWTAKNRPDGDLREMSKGDIENAARWKGTPGAFITRVTTVNFIEGDEYSFLVHRWKYWQKHFAKLVKRQQVRERVRKHRRNAHVTQMKQKSCDNVTPRVDKIRVDKRRSTPPTPPSGGTFYFEEFWSLQVHKTGKAECRRIWKRKYLDAFQGMAAKVFGEQLKWPQYSGERVQFMPRPARWLRGELWNDEPSEQATDDLPVLQFTQEGEPIV